jgi:hypothetical protein
VFLMRAPVGVVAGSAALRRRRTSQVRCPASSTPMRGRGALAIPPRLAEASGRSIVLILRATAERDG